MIVTYEDFENAIEVLEIANKLDKKSVREKYLSLTKLYHPDIVNGNGKKFQAINEAYKIIIIIYYIDNYKFEFSKEKFKKQYPFSDEKDWLSSM